MLDRQADSRPHTALYDAEMHGRLYLRLKAMEANGEPIYGHLPPGVAPAADASKEATYFNCSHTHNQAVKSLCRSAPSGMVVGSCFIFLQVSAWSHLLSG